MKQNCIILILLTFSCNLFADNVKEILARIPLTSTPFACTKAAPYPKPAIGYPADMESHLPLQMYQDLGLTQKNSFLAEIAVFRKFKPKEGNFDLVALDLDVSEWDKKILATYQKGELIDYIEVEVSWYSDGLLFVKQWQIDANQEVIVTWLKIESSTPISAFSNFDKIKAQRIDTHYKVDTNGKFQEVKQVKYRSQTYTKAYLIDKNKNLWDGNEIPINN